MNKDLQYFIETGFPFHVLLGVKVDTITAEFVRRPVHPSDARGQRANR